MKKLITKFIPTSIIQKYRNNKYKKQKSAFWGKSAKETFTQIYQSNHWEGKTSISGTGSDPLQTKTIIGAINTLIDEWNIKSILDLSCGDFTWMKSINLKRVKYLGADIVDNLIKDNLEKYSTNHIRFEVINQISDPLPKSDLIISRDSLVHFSFDDIYNSIKNIKISGSKYLLITTFPQHLLNHDITTGDWRTLNFQNAPFNFPVPLKIINENCTEGNGAFGDKSLALYSIDQIILPPIAY